MIYVNTPKTKIPVEVFFSMFLEILKVMDHRNPQFTSNYVCKGYRGGQSARFIGNSTNRQEFERREPKISMP